MCISIRFFTIQLIFLSLQLNIHRFKCLSRFGLAHVVAADICVWLRTLVKESNKEIALARVARGTGVSEDYMILGERMNYVLKIEHTHMHTSAHPVKCPSVYYALAQLTFPFKRATTRSAARSGPTPSG